LKQCRQDHTSRRPDIDKYYPSRSKPDGQSFHKQIPAFVRVIIRLMIRAFIA
jgi:hypothetical protein